MSMILCPECSNECSAAAASCPACGHPFTPEVETVVHTVAPPVVPPARVVVTEPRREKGFQNWMLAPLALVLVALVFGLMMFMRGNQDDANENVNVRIKERAAANSMQTNRTITSADSQTVTSVPQSADSSTVVVPPGQTTRDLNVPSAPTYSSDSSLPSSTTSLPPATTTSSMPSDKGNVELKATIVGRTGTSQTVKKEKFYLLSKDLNTILDKAGLEPEEGSYETTLGVLRADPTRSADLKKYLAAITPYIIASTTTDANGTAQFKNVKPDNYYLFGMTKVGDSVSVWNTSVVVNPGDNSIAVNGTATSSSMPSSSSTPRF